jgi:hypothetical protein
LPADGKPVFVEVRAPTEDDLQTVLRKIITRAMKLLIRDLEHYPNGGGELKIIAAILEQRVIEKILMHLGL